MLLAATSSARCTGISLPFCELWREGNSNPVPQRRLNQKGAAIEYFRKSLQQNPFLWSSYEALCELGVDEDAKQFFGGTEALATASTPLFKHSQPSLSEEASPLRY